jgi:hypothetical protein
MMFLAFTHRKSNLTQWELADELLVPSVLAPVILALQPAKVDAQTQSGRSPQRSPVHTTENEKMNAWTVGLAGGLLEGVPIRLAAEMACIGGRAPVR